MKESAPFGVDPILEGLRRSGNQHWRSINFFLVNMAEALEIYRHNLRVGRDAIIWHIGVQFKVHFKSPSKFLELVFFFFCYCLFLEAVTVFCNNHDIYN